MFSSGNERPIGVSIIKHFSYFTSSTSYQQELQALDLALSYKYANLPLVVLDGSKAPADGPEVYLRPRGLVAALSTDNRFVRAQLRASLVQEVLARVTKPYSRLHTRLAV